MSDLKVPLFDCEFGPRDEAAVLGPIRSGWLTLGEVTERFESEFSARTGSRHTIAVSSGTAALHLSLCAHGVGPGDEVLCPSMTFVATANAARYVGAEVVFCESIGPSNLNIDPDDVERKLSEKTKAIIVVHFAGYPADLPRLKEIADRRNIPLVEDAAHACISSLQGRSCGTWGACGCFSFFSNKNITCGEGGAIVTQDDALARRLRLLRAHAMTSSTLDRHEGRAHSYDVVDVGFNYRIDEIRSSLLLSQLESLSGYLEARRRHVRHYRELLETLPVDVPDFDWPELSADGDELAPHLLVVLLPETADRTSIMRRLREDGVQTSVHYPPVHRFESFVAAGAPQSLPRTESLAARELTLPLYPSMRDSQIELVCESLSRALR